MLNRVERWFLWQLICLGLAWALSPGVGKEEVDHGF